MAENTATPDNDAGLQLKKRARRRLVGAVALAVLAAIVLPMVMDHEPRPPAQDIQIRIPSQDAGSFTSRVLPGKATATPLPPVAEKPAAKPESKPEPKPEARPEPVAELKPATKPEADAKPEAKPEAKKAEPKSNEAARAEAALAGGSAEAKPDTAKSEQWVLQLGAYQDPGNVKALQAKIKELGYPSYTEKVSTPQGERIRVRAGPFSTKAAAEKAQAGLKKIGAGGPPGGVVAPK